MGQIIASTYEIIEKIGAGGGGNVYLANHLRLGKRVVLKADKREMTTRPELLRREVDVLKNLNHPNIPVVYDFFAENGIVYTVMDFIEGESLDKPLKRGEKYPQAQVIQWAIQLLEALKYLHSPVHGTPPKGYVHSDIKPANLMRRPNNDICLIDFNIALALGEKNVVGCSIGYASPEHYGLDYSFGAEQTLHGNTVPMPGPDRKTVLMPRNMGSTSGKRTVIPDVRSDIYSTGATLYHLLSGRRPEWDAKTVVPLSDKEFSPQVVKIITKAMNPNPDLRYQTAEEMLNDFLHLRDRDPRVLKMRRQAIVGGAVFLLLLSAELASSFVGLKRMQTTENWLKLAEYSRNALETGDSALAIDYALQALPERTGSILEPPYTAQAQSALTDALAVYDLYDGYKTQGAVNLPAPPLAMEISPDGRTAVCIYAYEAALIDTETAQILKTLPVAESALSEVHYLDKDTVLLAGADGITAYDIPGDRIIWTGNMATAIAVSGDGKRAAAVYRDEQSAALYDTKDGRLLKTVDFGGRSQSVTVNDIFANPRDNLLALNEDGTLLGASFADGSLQIFDLENPDDDIILFDPDSGYSHFEGGFYQEYFAFAATTPGDSMFGVIDTENMVQTGGFESDQAFGVETDGSGIYVQTQNLLVKIDPVTGGQEPLVTTPDNILRFARGGGHTLIASEDKFMFYDSYANLMSTHTKEYGGDFVRLAEGVALVGSMDSPLVRVMKYIDYPEAEVFSYDSSYVHDEARLSADGKTVMLFAYDQFRLCRLDGGLIAEVDIPDAEQVYDQQYRRDADGSRLEVIYNDGTVRNYSAADGSLISEESGEAPAEDLYEEFCTDNLRITSPLHGTPAAYDRESGRLVRELEKDAYLTYVTQTGDYIVTQYTTADGYFYGQLLNGQCEVLAELPYLCDVYDGTLYFDYPTGHVRESRIYDIGELIGMARAKKDERKQ